MNARRNVFDSMFGWCGSSEGQIYVFECYLDDSDNNQGGPVLGLGGFVTTWPMWKVFEPAADRYLKTWNVDVLRGKDFHNRHGVFKDWDHEKKTEFVDGLISLINRFGLFGIGAVVDKKFYIATRKSDVRLKNISPLGWAFNSIIGSMLKLDDISRHLDPDRPVSFLIESGNKNNGNLIRLLRQAKRIEHPDTQKLGNVGIVDKRDCRAIQFADFFAFHMRKGAEKWAAQGYPASPPDVGVMSYMWERIDLRVTRFFDRPPMDHIATDAEHGPAVGILFEKGLR